MRNPTHHEGLERRRFHRPDDMYDAPDDGRSRGRGHHGPRGRGRRGGRMGRGDVRAAILALLNEEPMHGYQLMQAITERTGGRWRPSPGAIYPAINQLEDEGLVSVTADSGRKLVVLTEAGREQAQAAQESGPAPFGDSPDGDAGPDLRSLLGQLHEATRQVGRTGTETQVEAAAKILTEARRSMYLLLADGPEAADE